MTLTMDQLLEPLARYRTDEVVVTTMSAVRPWGRRSSSELDFASADSAMGHAADLALGVALARPERKVVCLNGDGSMLMCLGTLATAVDVDATNYVLIVCDNGAYEITGGQAIAASRRIDFGAIARATGFRSVYTVTDPTAWETVAREVLTEPGPTLVHARVALGDEGPIGRGDHEPARYLRHALSEWSVMMRAALTGADDVGAPDGHGGAGASSTA